MQPVAINVIGDVAVVHYYFWVSEQRPHRIDLNQRLELQTGASFGASAADVEVRCEKRSARSSASVDGSNLASGEYRAVLKSGTKIARSPFAATIGDEAQFDFDSKNTEVAEGATSIQVNFIVDGRVRGYLVNTSGERVTPVVTAMCRIRS